MRKDQNIEGTLLYNKQLKYDYISSAQTGAIQQTVSSKGSAVPTLDQTCSSSPQVTQNPNTGEQWVGSIIPSPLQAIWFVWSFIGFPGICTSSLLVLLVSFHCPKTFR